MNRTTPLLMALALASASGATTASGTDLPRIGPAPAFSLTDRDGRAFGLADLRGSVVVVDFIFASCTDRCPVQTEKLAQLRGPLGSHFGPDVRFVSISVDPEHDTPQALARYAGLHHALTPNWAFLTGPQDEIRRVAQGYGVAVYRSAGGAVTHNSLTSVIDASGMLRVQYAGVRYATSELLADIRSLLRERSGR